MRAAWALAKRELFSYFLSPISYVVAALFLVVHGYSFFLLCQILQARAASTGAVMQYFFGGTFLYWLFLMFVVSVLTMRLIAEERQHGTLEPLLSAPVREGAVIVGKYLGALAFYLFLWAPTLAYVALLRAHAGDAAALDPGPIAAGYLGTLLIGASSLAVGLLASTLTRSLVLSAVLSFCLLSLLLLVGMLADLYVKHEVLRQVLLYVNLFYHMEELGRGIVDSRRVVLHLSLAAAVLLAAARALRVRPGDRIGSARALAEGTLVLALLVGVNVLSARHSLRSDWTRTRQFTLSDRLLALLAELGERQVAAYVFMYDDGADRNDLYDDVHELLLRAQRAARGRLQVEFIDVDRDRERARLLAERYRISRDDLREGVIVVESGGRQKFIRRAELAEYETRPTEVGPAQQLVAFRGEEALASALLSVLEERAVRVCFSRGHGEPEHDSLTGSGLSDLSEALRRDNFEVRGLDQMDVLATPDRGGCDVLAVVGPERPFLPREVQILAGFLDGGGSLLLLSGPVLDRGLGRFVELGIEPLLAARGIRLGQAVVLDPDRRLGDSLAWLVEDGYADHPVSAPLMHRRTLWSLVRPVRPVPTVPLPSGSLWSAEALVTTGEHGFAETDLEALAAGTASYTQGRDEQGALPVMAAAVEKERAGRPPERPGRIVVLGSSQFGSNDTMALYNRDLLLSAVAYLADVHRRVLIAPKRPEALRLALTEDQQRRLLLVTLVGMPLMALLLGAGMFWIRRA
ncbi:MAG: Gldg family protein [Myxococcales bacterium]|nr:Gldg family protein [Myxococcales bacterium]